MHYTVETTDGGATTMSIAARICRKCGAQILADAPQGFCSACLLETGLGLLVDEVEEPLNEMPARRYGVTGRAIRMLGNFGDYDLLEEIGRGGQGVVYRARQKSLNRTVALKVIGLGHWATEAHIKRFRLEAEAVAGLDNPGIIPIYEIGERDGSCYFSMKFVEGGQLDEIIKREPIAIRRAAALVAKLARTIHYAHERGILHRDVKPGNILLDRDGEPHLTDFGLARLVETESNVTRTLDVLGTPSYMAPEQAAGHTAQISRATDVYGLGAVFYQLLTGQPPFAGGTTYETIRLVLETEPRKPRLWNPKVNRDLETICLKCLEKDPHRRYSSALALAEDLERWARHEPIHARPSGMLTRGRKWVRRNPALAILLPVLIALVLTVGTMIWNRELEAPLPSGIAVLPFENLGEDKGNSSFADGIQDDILTKLAKVADLKVISRTSVMQYRGDRNVRKIGNALHVSHVLEGSVRKAGSKLRLNAQLIDARTDRHVWAEQYDGEITDVFAMQSAIAQKIVNQLSAKISAAEKQAIEKTPTHDLEAYDLYVRAKSLSGVSSPDDPKAVEQLLTATDLLELAVSRDPNFASAYALLTEANLNLYWGLGRADATYRARAQAALEVTQRLAPDAGETHLARALFHYHGNHDYDHALEELDMAARLLPNNADVFRVTAQIERRLARWNEALRHFSKANELDPRDPVCLAQIAVTYGILRHFAEAEQTADRGIAAFPETADDFWHRKANVALAQGDLTRARTALEKISGINRFPWLRFRILFYSRNYSEAERFSLEVRHGKDDSYVRFGAWWSGLAARGAGHTERMRSFFVTARQAHETSLRQQPNEPATLSDVGMLDALLGRKEEALREAQRAVELRPISRDALEGPEYVRNLAAVYAWTGERERAIEQLLSIAKVANGPSFGDLKLAPFWDELRGDPRFTEIMSEAAKPIPLE